MFMVSYIGFDMEYSYIYKNNDGSIKKFNNLQEAKIFSDNYKMSIVISCI